MKSALCMAGRKCAILPQFLFQRVQMLFGNDMLKGVVSRDLRSVLLAAAKPVKLSNYRLAKLFSKKTNKATRFM